MMQARKMNLRTPKHTLNACIEVAAAVGRQEADGFSLQLLAKALGYTAKPSGAFAARLASAKAFGLITGKSRELKVTDRGRQLIKPCSAKDAEMVKRQAFMSVELYRSIYNFSKTNAGRLPIGEGLKNLLLRLGVGRNRVLPASKIFRATAGQAGLYIYNDSATEMKLVDYGKEVTSKPNPPSRVTVIHPVLADVLRELPRPGPWQLDKKKSFLTCFRNAFDLVYPDAAQLEK